MDKPKRKMDKRVINKIKTEYFRTLMGAAKIAKKLKVPVSWVRKVLMNLEAYQRTIEVKAKGRRKFMAKTVAYPRRNNRDDCYQSDLLDMSPTQHLRNLNKGARFLVMVIDVYSRFLWVFPIKKKTTVELMRTLGKFLSKKKPKNLTYDEEAAIMSNIFRAHLKKLDIKLYNPEKQPNDFKGATSIVERVNRTIRTLITRYRVANKDKRWISDLPRIVRGYNESPHRSLKWKTPKEVYRDQNSEENMIRKIFEFKKGSFVRIRVNRKNLYEKKSLPPWSKGMYTVITKTGQKYKLKNNTTGELRKNRVAPQDMLLVPESTFSVRRRTRGRAVGNLPKSA